MGIKRIILTILICLLLSPLNVFAITYGKTGADTNFNGDINVPSGFNYYINGVVLNLGETNTASNIGAQVEIYKQKTGVDLEFRTLKADSSKIIVSITPDALDVGVEAINRAAAGYAGRCTVINKDNPVNVNGIIATIEIWAAVTLADCEVATFYGSANNLTTRDYETVGTVTAGSKQTFEVSLNAQVGDFIGMTYSSGQPERDDTGSVGLWSAFADYIPCTAQAFDFTANRVVSLYGKSGVTLNYVRFDIVESEIRLDDLKATEDNTDLNASTTAHGLMPKLPFSGDLLSTTTVSFAVDGDTTLFTVPTGKRCVLSHAIVVAAADAGATTTISIGQDTAETDFVPANTLSNLDAEFDAVILQPIPNTIPLKIKSYAAATIIQAQVATQSGAAGNTVYLFGILY